MAGRPPKYRLEVIKSAIDAYIAEQCDGNGKRFKQSDFLRYAENVCNLHISRSTLYSPELLEYIDNAKESSREKKSYLYKPLDIPVVMEMKGKELASLLVQLDEEREELMENIHVLQKENDNLKKEKRKMASDDTTVTEQIRNLKSELCNAQQTIKQLQTFLKQVWGEYYRCIEGLPTALGEKQIQSIQVDDNVNVDTVIEELSVDELFMGL